MNDPYITNEVAERLVKNAVDCTYYVACGDGLKKELSEKHRVPSGDVSIILDTVAVKLDNYIRAFKL